MCRLRGQCFCTVVGAAQVNALLAHACLGLDCHEFSSAPASRASPPPETHAGTPREMATGVGVCVYVLMRSSLRPRVMCGIRDSSHKHMHTQYTHTHTHTHTRTHTHTHKYIHTPTPTPVARSCVLSLSKSLSISLSLGVPACVSGGGDALLAGADENSWQSRPRHAACQQCIDLGCANYGAEALPA